MRQAAEALSKGAEPSGLWSTRLEKQKPSKPKFAALPVARRAHRPYPTRPVARAPPQARARLPLRACVACAEHGREWWAGARASWRHAPCSQTAVHFAALATESDTQLRVLAARAGAFVDAVASCRWRCGQLPLALVCGANPGMLCGRRSRNQAHFFSRVVVQPRRARCWAIIGARRAFSEARALP